LIAVASVAILLLASIVEPAAAGTTRHERLAAIVGTVAGRPVDSSCETNRVAWVGELVQGQMAADAVAYYDPDIDVIRFGPVICNDLLKPGRGVTLRLVRGLFIAAHEAAHAAGVDDEGVANCWGLYWAQDLARRFAGVRFFTRGSNLVRTYARQVQKDSPPDYRAVCPVSEKGTTPWQPPTLSPTTAAAPGTRAQPAGITGLPKIEVSLNLPPSLGGLPPTSRK
jgi:hypothetical protein